MWSLHPYESLVEQRVGDRQREAREWRQVPHRRPELRTRVAFALVWLALRIAPAGRGTIGQMLGPGHTPSDETAIATP